MMTASEYLEDLARERTWWDRAKSFVNWQLDLRWRRTVVNLGRSVPTDIVEHVSHEWLAHAPRGSRLVLRCMDRMGTLLNITTYRVSEPSELYGYDISLMDYPSTSKLRAGVWGYILARDLRFRRKHILTHTSLV